MAQLRTTYPTACKSFIVVGLLMFNISFSSAQSVVVADFAAIEKELTPRKDTLTVVNFWATWCKPCVEELKYFREVMNQYPDTSIRWVFVSLDFKSNINKVKEFVRKQKINNAHFYLLYDNANVWINKVDEEWVGDLPYTLVIPEEADRMKYTKAFPDEQELKKLILPFVP